MDSQINTFYGGLLGSQIPEINRFKLSSQLIEEYRKKPVPFGFNGLGEVVYLRTYAREKDNKCEVWVDTVERVVNGVFEILQHYIVNKLHCECDIHKITTLAEDMFKRIFDMKFLPPGRGLWAMGAPIITKKGFAAALNNCAFVSTNNIEQDRISPFTFLMDASMLGVGVGFDTTGAGSFIIQEPKLPCIKYIISDDREGWVESVRLLLNAYFNNSNDVEFNYSQIRELGTKLRTFGGTSSGPGPLITLHKNIRKILDTEKGKPISVTCITDIMNMIGVCTVSGNIRRCLPKNSLIHTNTGLVNIQDIKIGSYVQTSSGYEKVTHVYNQGKQQLLTLITHDGEFKCTVNHRMAVLDTFTTYKWKHAIDIKAGDKLLTSRTPIIGYNTTLPEISVNSNNDDWNIPVLDADIAWLIGIYCYNGYTEIINNDGYITITIDIEYDNCSACECTSCNCLCKDSNYSLTDEFDIMTKIKQQLGRFGTNLRISTYEQEGYYVVKCVSYKLAQYFNMHLAHSNKDIPDYIKQGNLSVRLGFIAGIIDTHIYKNKESIQIVNTVHKKWIQQLQILCYSCGFETKLTRTNHHIPNEMAIDDRIYILTVESKHSRDIINNIPQLFRKFKVDGMYDYLDKPDLYSRNYLKYTTDKISYVPTVVLGIEIDDLFDTYDITVENKHEFFCNGYLTHNSAEIAFGQADCKEFLNLKSYDVNPQRQEHGWASNNSIFAKIGMDYTDVCDHIRTNGEPGLAWLSNMQSFSRMNGKPDYKDQRVAGGNPCLEQSLESMELCCLVETFPNKHTDLDDFKETLKSAFLFAKTVTLLPLHWHKSNEIMMRNRRIGCSVSGVAQFITDHGIDELKTWLETGYDTLKEVDIQISEWLCIRKSIKITSVKPSGTVSLLAGATPGMHYPEAKYYIRRIRLASDSYLLNRLIKAGYHVEPCIMSPDTTVVVEFPVCAGNEIRTTRDVSMWEQLSLAAFMQRYWADNQVSATVTFDPETEGNQIANALNYFQYQLKGISFLPRLSDDTIYKQIPYEAITKEQYLSRYNKINKHVTLSTEMETTATDDTLYTYCDNDKCIRI